MKNIFYFTRAERRGILVLLFVLLVLVGVNYYFINKIRHSRAVILLEDKYESTIDSLVLADSLRQVEHFEKYRSNQENCTQEVLSNKVVVGQELAHVVVSKQDLNTADSIQLVTLKGIGPTYAHRIVAYRELLGGYYSVDQLREIKGMTQENFDRICNQVQVDASKLVKINLNEVSYEDLKRHPYVSAKQAYYLVKQRNQENPWKSVEEIQTDEEVLTTEVLQKIQPYLIFE